jgi:5'-deoxynucleotidase
MEIRHESPLCLSIADEIHPTLGTDAQHVPRNVQEHSLRVAIVAHALAMIRNRLFSGHVNAERTAVLALYHDATEVLTGDLPAPVKYFNPEIKTAYKQIEAAAGRRLLQMVPDALKMDYEGLFLAEEADDDSRDLGKAADKICAYLKMSGRDPRRESGICARLEGTKSQREELKLPEVHYLLEMFVPSFRLTLDELY